MLNVFGECTRKIPKVHLIWEGHESRCPGHEPTSTSPTNRTALLLPLLYSPFREEIYLNLYFWSKPTNEGLEIIFFRRTELAVSPDNHFNYKDVE